MDEEKRIGVTVLSGFLGSGKTTLLNRLLQEPTYSDAVVIINEYGDVGVDHHLVRLAQDNIMLVEGGCLCCAVSGAVVDALRDLFMLALRRQIKPFRRVLIETSGLADPAPVLFTLKHDRFLAERYVYRGAIVVVDAQHGAEQLAGQPEAARQLALADTVVFSKADLTGDASLQALQRQVEAINPGARRCVQRQDLPLVEALAGWPDIATRRAELSNWLRAFAQPVAGGHGQVSSFSLTLEAPIGRAAFLAGISLVQERYRQGLLRLKGLVCFEGEALPCEVHGVHGELYPLRTLPQWPSDERASRLVCILRGPDAAEVQACLRRALGQLPA